MRNVNHLIRPDQSPEIPAKTSAPPQLNERFQPHAELQQVASGQHILSKGAEGDSVKAIQTALTNLGFYSGDRADGAYGAQTAKFRINGPAPINRTRPIPGLSSPG